MFPRKTLDLVILSILDEFPKDGLTGYALIKEIKRRFGVRRTPSAGTIYPIAKKLKESGDLLEDGKNYKISEKGKKKLAENIPKIMENNLQSIPNFYSKLYGLLMHSLPFAHKIKYFPNMSHFFGCEGCSSESFFDDPIISSGKNATRGFSNSLKRLEQIKNQLITTKKKIQEQMTKQVRLIDVQIKKVSDKIELLIDEKKGWKKIEIEES
ncbi:MAG: PadR family transcriptional regulator [Promethearchaeota archaeon]